MKLIPRQHSAGVTLDEVLCILVFVGIPILMLAWMLLLPRMGVSRKSGRIKCVNNLKQIGTAFHEFASDNGCFFPLQAEEGAYIRQPGETNAGPGAVVSTNAQAWQVYQALWNELQTPKILLCPNDSSRIAFQRVVDFSGVAGSPGKMTTASFGHPENQNRATSYTPLALAAEALPLQLLSAERNINSASSTNAAATMRPRPSGIRYTVASESSAKTQYWISGPGAKIHGLAGNLSFADGSVQQATATVLQRSLLNAGAAYGWGTATAPGPGAAIFLMP